MAENFNTNDLNAKIEIEKIQPNISNKLNQKINRELENRSNLITLSNQIKNENFEKNIKIPNQKGLFAHSIWENIRENSDSKLNNFDLQKQLQNIDYYSQVKLQTSNKQKNNNNHEEEIAKITNPIDMSKVIKAKVYRDELELMYRSSKMNEIRTNILNKSETNNLSVDNENISIIKYLPIEDLNNIPNKSLLEVNKLQLMKKKQPMENKRKNLNKSIGYNIFGFQYQDGKSKIEKQNLKLKFLEESPYQIYLNSRNDLKSNLVVDNTLKSSKAKYFDKANSKEEITLGNSNKFPPLTINALMEYKPLLKAPGAGDFENGQSKLFKLS